MDGTTCKTTSELKNVVSRGAQKNVQLRPVKLIPGE